MARVLRRRITFNTSVRVLRRRITFITSVAWMAGLARLGDVRRGAVGRAGLVGVVGRPLRGVLGRAGDGIARNIGTLGPGVDG